MVNWSSGSRWITDQLVGCVCSFVCACERVSCFVFGAIRRVAPQVRSLRAYANNHGHYQDECKFCSSARYIWLRQHWTPCQQRSDIKPDYILDATQRMHIALFPNIIRGHAPCACHCIDTLQRRRTRTQEHAKPQQLKAKQNIVRNMKFYIVQVGLPSTYLRYIYKHRMLSYSVMSSFFLLLNLRMTWLQWLPRWSTFNAAAHRNKITGHSFRYWDRIRCHNLLVGI